MTTDEYVAKLEDKVKMFDDKFVEETKDWATSDKLYVYLHKIQLEYMRQFSEDMDWVSRQVKWIRAQTS
jgi:hypothetical protein